MSIPSSRPGPTLTMVLGLALILAGCDQPTGSTRRLKPKPEPEAVDLTPPAPVVAPREILGKTTQDIRDMEKEKQAGGVAKQPRIITKDPIMLPGSAYVSIVSQASQLQITHSLDLYQADNNGEYPKTLDEFMEKIIKPNGIKLPTLPFYQEYAYDAPNHKLVIMEYPDRKEAANYPK